MAHENKREKRDGETEGGRRRDFAIGRAAAPITEGHKRHVIALHAQDDERYQRPRPYRPCFGGSRLVLASQVEALPRVLRLPRRMLDPEDSGSGQRAS